MKLQELKNGFTSVIDSVADGWHHLRDSAASAVTRFKAHDGGQLPARHEVDDQFYWPDQGWSMLGGDVFEDEGRVVVRLEVPGMDKKDFKVEVLDDTLVVSGEKRFERENSEGRYRLLQCAYGSFRRVVSLPAAVLADKARADYKDGVLRIELPKAEAAKTRRLTVKVA